jgi:hypothetical protein
MSSPGGLRLRPTSGGRATGRSGKPGRTPKSVLASFGRTAWLHRARRGSDRPPGQPGHPFPSDQPGLPCGFALRGDPGTFGEPYDDSPRRSGQSAISPDPRSSWLRSARRLDPVRRSRRSSERPRRSDDPATSDSPSISCEDRIRNVFPISEPATHRRSREVIPRPFLSPGRRADAGSSGAPAGCLRHLRASPASGLRKSVERMIHYHHRIRGGNRSWDSSEIGKSESDSSSPPRPSEAAAIERFSFGCPCGAGSSLRSGAGWKPHHNHRHAQPPDPSFHVARMISIIPSRRIRNPSCRCATTGIVLSRPLVELVI